MKNSSVLVVLLITLSGCAANPERQSRAFDNEVHVSDSGKKLTVNALRKDYKSKTGNELIAKDTLSCDWDGECYYNRWVSAYNEGIREIEQEMKRDAIEHEQRCRADVTCMRDREVESATNDLNFSYRVVMAQNPYFQSDLDASVRQLCRRSGNAERSGISLEQIRNNLDLIEGIAPNDRILMKKVAS